MKKSSAYWQKRFQAIEDMNNKAAKETVQSITPAFDKAQQQIEKEINAWYGRFANNNQISLQEAKKLLTAETGKQTYSTRIVGLDIDKSTIPLYK